ncbi:hypothetical protein C7974DRAFT_2827 [Boeremia exigua]|uniref:uncharacterized protein n=1 Tax=Boeremia exigua TaxID=749465 RepID=UPI001E8D127F|nr:uncharacterized protein C7974DRAFT_2827 [Boeremia exigua]KAH6643663.1 hypothetical protein C7974DRAFT_2827 [Boeremia exigua]
MMLTLSKPAKWDFDVKTHDYPPPFSTSTIRHSPQLNGGPSPSHSAGPNYAMSTSHRGLPPPSAMTLPDPGRGAPPIQSSMGSSSLGALPPAPSQWQGSEDGMKNWLAAKAEEEKRKQEEEKTRQENLKLEQRKIEHSMLRESMQGGVPPHLVPIIFAGIGGGNLANISAEWIQQYTVQVQQAQQQAQAQAQLSPELRRETRLLGQQPQTVYAGQPPVSQTILPPTAVLPGQPLSTQPQQTYVSDRAAPAPGHSGQLPSATRPLHQSQLPKLTTNEMHIQQPPTTQSQMHQNQNAQEQSSPSIYFHHWVPPTSQQEKNTSGHPPATPSGKYKSSPSTSYQSRQRATSHASDREYISSPKKRKAQGAHAAPPPPTSAPQSYTSPSFSHVSTSSTSTPGRGGHARARSDASARGTEGSVSRRGTVSGLAHETRQSDMQEPQRAPEGRPSHGPDVPYGTPPLRNETRSYVQQSPAPNAGSGPPETPTYGMHQQWNRGYHTSPKREADH